MFNRKAKQQHPGGDLKTVLGDYELPNFPSTVMKALQELRRPGVQLSKIGDTVAADPGVSVSLLRTVNSAAFSFRHRVKNVHHAVAILGHGQLESLLISLGVHAALPKTPTLGFEDRRFWLTAARRASCARALAEKIDPSCCSESFTASFLQDMAMPVLAHHKGATYGKLLEAWHHGREDVAKMERAEFGWDHAEVGSWMSTDWNFPFALAEAIGDHHTECVRGREALPAVKLVSVLREVDDDFGREQLVENAHSIYALPKDEVVELLETSYDGANSMLRTFV